MDDAQTLPPPPGTPPPKRSRRKTEEPVADATLFNEASEPAGEEAQAAVEIADSETPITPSASPSIPAIAPGPASLLVPPSLEMVQIPEAARKELVCVTLRLPLAEPPDNQVDRINAWHVDCQFRDSATREAFRQLKAGLDVSGARLADGKRVVTGADSIRWIIQQIVAALNAQ